MDGDDDEISSRIQSMGGKLSRTRAMAHYIVIENVENPGCRNQLAMMLRGGVLLSRSCFKLEEGALSLCNGVRIAYRNLLSQPKWICLTTGFRRTFQGMAQVIDQAIHTQTKRRLWKSLAYDEFVVCFSISQTSISGENHSTYYLLLLVFVNLRPSVKQRVIRLEDSFASWVMMRKHLTRRMSKTVSKITCST